VRVIYPACGGGLPADYVNGALVDVMKDEGYYGLDEAVIESWRDRTVGVKNAAPCGGALPLATLSIGLGVSGAHYSLLAERLAGEGYAVAIIDHPHGAPSILPDGTILLASADEALARIDEDPAVLAARVADWAADISVTLNALTSGGVEGLNIDGERLAATGHSMGGAAALDACASDARLKACVNMDGAPFGAKVMDRGLSGNAFVLLSDPLYTDEELASRGRSREQWTAMGEQITGLWAELAESGENETVVLRVAGTGHLSFSDAPLVMPELITQFGGNPMEPSQAVDVISGAVAAIMESKTGLNDAALSSYVEKTPELERVQQPLKVWGMLLQGLPPPASSNLSARASFGNSPIHAKAEAMPPAAARNKKIPAKPAQML
jgi:hypothetical protein